MATNEEIARIGAVRKVCWRTQFSRCETVLASLKHHARVRPLDEGLKQDVRVAEAAYIKLLEAAP